MLRPSTVLASLVLALAGCRQGPRPASVVVPDLVAARACQAELSYEEALAAYERALAADPGCAEASRGAGVCRRLMGRDPCAATPSGVAG